MKYLFRKEEREAVEDKFCDELVFEAMRVPCQAMMNEAKTFAMHPSELFYHVLFTIDDIRSRTLVAAQRYCDKALWDDILSDIRDKAEYCDQEEVSRVVGMILYGTAMVLIWSGKPAYTSISGVLMKQVEAHVPDYADKMSKRFNDGFSIPDATALRQSITDYLESERQFSAEIEEVMDEIPLASVKAPTISEPVTIGLAKGKETSVLVVLEAMYKAGWLVDADKKPLTNRDEALKQIMKNAFGKDNTNVSQLLGSVKNRNKAKGKQSIFDELLEQI